MPTTSKHGYERSLLCLSVPSISTKPNTNTKLRLNDYYEERNLEADYPNYSDHPHRHQFVVHRTVVHGVLRITLSLRILGLRGKILGIL